ncbi:MAG TPA: RNA polymerase sigma-70 factor [Chloroflexota bacterium]
MADDLASLRPYLFSIAYRLVGSASEAEDLVQEAFVRYMAAQPEDVRSKRAFLSTIVTRLSLDHLKSARVQREAYVGPWLPEPVLTERNELGPLESVEQRESVSLAMLVLLERLSPEERAVFVLHEAFEYPFADVGEVVGKGAAACRQVFHRARERLSAGKARFSASRQVQQSLVEQFIAAAERGDMRSLSAVLAEDVTVWGDGGGKVAAGRRPVAGREAVLRFLDGIVRLAPPNTSFAIADVNGTPGLLVFFGTELAQVSTIDVVDGQIAGIRNVLNPDKLAFVQRQLTEMSHVKPADAPVSR